MNHFCVTATSKTCPTHYVSQGRDHNSQRCQRPEKRAKMRGRSTCPPLTAHYLLMLLLSLSRSPRAPVLATRSLPAKSTKLSLLTFSEPLCQKTCPLDTHAYVAKVRGMAPHLSPRVEHCLSEANGKHSVRARTLGVHLRGRHSPRFVSLRHELRDVVERCHCEPRQALNVGTQDLVLSHLKGLLATAMGKNTR